MGFYLILQEDTLWDNVINGLRKELLDSGQRHCQVGSLAGAAHLLKNNTGVLRWTQREQKSRVEYKDKSLLDLDFQ